MNKRSTSVSRNSNITKVINISNKPTLSRNIIAIGDVHGDYEATVESLRITNVINHKLDWTGKNNILIQMGDILDRGGRNNSYGDEDSELKIIYLFQRLKKQAQKEGGDVVCLIGNHELMNLQGICDYCSKLGIKRFGNVKNRVKFYKPGNKMAISMTKLFKAIYKIGPWLFVHGGIRSLLSKKYTVDYINNLMNRYLLGDIKLEDSKEFQELFLDDNSIFWYRGFSDTAVNCKQLNKSLSNLDAKYMVVGHTPQDCINTKCHNRIWRIDTAMSEAFGKRKNNKRISAMVITDKGKKVNIYCAK
jgi:hypothetical protein